MAKKIRCFPKNAVDCNGEKILHNYTKFPFKTWFEYHCNESHDSADAKLWYHSHQRCTVLCPIFWPRYPRFDCETYKIRFDDGFESCAGGDELMRSKKQFYRPNPLRLTHPIYEINNHSNYSHFICFNKLLRPRQES